MLSMLTDEAGGLDLVDDLIHDHFFDVEEIKLHRGRLTVPFLRPSIGRPHRGPDVQSKLTIHHVIQATINDTQRIALYDFNRLRYDAEHRTLTVETGVPMTFSVVVERLEVSVEIGSQQDASR